MSQSRIKSLFWGKKRAPTWAALFLLSLVFVFFVLPEWATLNRLIPSVSDRFRTATGHPLSIGKIRLSFLTGPELRLQQVVIGGSAERPLAEAQEIRIGFQLLPLLWKRVEIVEIRLFEPAVSLIRNSRGEWNVEDLFRRNEQQGGWTVSVRSGLFTIRGGILFITDQSPSREPLQWTVRGIEMVVRRPFWDGRVDLQVAVPAVWQGALVEKATDLKVNGRVEGEGGLFGFKKETARFDVSLNRFDSDLIRFYLPETIPSVLFQSGRFTMVGRAADFLSLSLPRLFRSPDFRLEGESNRAVVLLAKDLAPMTIERATWRYDHREGRFTFQNAHLLNSILREITGSLSHPLTEGRLEMKSSGEVSLSDAAEVALKRFGIKWPKRLKADGIAEMTLTMKRPLGAPSQTEFYGDLLIHDGTITPFSSFRPIQKIKGTIRMNGKNLLIESAEGEWGGGRLTATGKMPDLYEEGIEFDLRATTLDWDTVRLPSDESAAVGPSETRSKAPPTAPEEGDEKGYAVGLLRIEHLKIKEYDFFRCQSALTYQAQTLEFRDTEANFEEGVFKADFAQVHFRPDDSVTLALTPDLQQVNVAEFLSDFRGDGERPVMTGRALVAGGLNSQGSNFEEFKRNLSGKLVVYIEKGTIYRFKTLARIFSLMNLRSLPDLDVKGVLYDALSGTLSINEGKVTLYDTILFGRDVRVIANGDINLAKDEYDLLMGVQVFRVVDEFLKEIPVAGPILLGKDKMFIASYFEVQGRLANPEVHFMPFKSIKESTLAVLRRALTYPVKPEEFSG